jgi:hypothetical protein
MKRFTLGPGARTKQLPGGLGEAFSLEAGRPRSWQGGHGQVWSEPEQIVKATVVIAIMILTSGCEGRATRRGPFSMPSEPKAEHAAVAPDAHEAAAAELSQLPTFRDGVARLIELDTAIREAAEAGMPEAGHDALHEIGIVLEELPGLAKNSETPLDLAAVKRSSSVLFDAYSRIDEEMHGGEGSTYAEESQDIAREISGYRAFLVEHATP